ncbi:hypothetical protein GGTG_03833 [Gaeumannomyces tritici R3-111a-1]|uniref:Uncharacterized protein n=1 Tax=Gaeumannomyces tritici (strain R3-111a-1) TaxID=644352 RepID=J3NRC9_GAET3|nr:hypothetical protein GGTG_03833 [Gaeumannomyces tritici R3-111a-1]EJT78735.1 hypothetical protein GGTG_03833 [Gaeumannomyces tritici R3-111a-1]
MSSSRKRKQDEPEDELVSLPSGDEEEDEYVSDEDEEDDDVEDDDDEEEYEENGEDAGEEEENGTVENGRPNKKQKTAPSSADAVPENGVDEEGEEDGDGNDDEDDEEDEEDADEGEEDGDEDKEAADDLPAKDAVKVSKVTVAKDAAGVTAVAAGGDDED